RMTGCPNGCARPMLAEIAFIGKAPGKYNMYLGGGHSGNRLNKLYKENIGEAEILESLQPMVTRYAKERHENEHFGDFVIRAGYVKEDNAQIQPSLNRRLEEQRMPWSFSVMQNNEVHP
ncbi:hypothetical protein FU659_34355, partial [Paenibacillus sp. N3.4]